MSAPFTPGREEGSPAEPDGSRSPAAPRNGDPSILFILGSLVALAALLFGLRLGGPPNLTDNDQERPAAYVLDALVNGHWAVQRDWTGDIASKPPLYTWLAAGLSAAVGRASLATLYLPCALALLGAAMLVALLAHRQLGPRAAWLAGIFLLANPLAAKLVALARTDAVFTFTVTLTAWLAFRAWEKGHGWTAAWLAAAAATLTKGPVGVVLGFSGLAAWVLERRHGTRSPSTIAHWGGLALWLAVCGGWFFLAWSATGDALIDKQLRSELVDHALGARRSLPGAGLLLTPAYFLTRFQPCSLLAFWGLGEALRRPEGDPGARRLQRFAAFWLLSGLVLFGLAAHQRGDLIAPLMPAGAILAAIPAARWTGAWTTRRFVVVTGASAVLLALGMQAQHAWRRLPVFEQSQGVAAMARGFLDRGGDARQIAHVDTPYALQFHLGTMQSVVTYAEAAALLGRGERRYVALTNRAALLQAFGPESSRLHLVAEWPAGEAATHWILELVPPGR